ncbi:MAG: ABC transporter permease [Cryobacterium sp.]|nr:ABC transporter permease [Cryobacterium sp.]
MTDNTPAFERSATGFAGLWRGVPWSSLAIVGPFVLLFAVLSIASPSFLTPLNLTNLLDRQSGILIIAAASTLVLIAGGIDLSVGATYMLASVVCAHFVLTSGTWVGVIAALAAGLIIGLLNGVISTYLRVSPLIATLAMSFIISGATMLVQQGRLLNLTSADYDDFKAIAQTRFIGLPASVWIAVIVIVVLAVVLARTTGGRYIYAAGGNAEAARLAGIRVNLTQIATFAVTGVAAAIAGILDTARTSGVPTTSAVATTITFTVLAGIVVGGTSIFGGEGAVWRTVIGVLFIALIYNGFNLLRIDPLFQQIALGTILLVAVGVDAWSRARKR